MLPLAATDLVAIEDEDMITQAASNLDQLYTHGAVVLPSLLPLNITRQLREVILSKNKAQSRSDQFYVLNHDYRYSLVTSIHHGHDLVHDPDDHLSRALSHIASNTKLKALLTSALHDDDPSLVEMSAITVLYGAESQPWHADTLPDQSSLLFGNTYSDLYTVFVALQDTSNEMGATELCLGTHMCGDWDEEHHRFVPNVNSDGGGKWETSKPHMCDQVKEFTLPNGTSVKRRRGVQVPLKAGDAFVYNSELIHRGRDHVDLLATERVQLLLSFTSRPMQILGKDFDGNEVVDWRVPPNGATYALKWDSWGRTLSDLAVKRSDTSTFTRRVGLDSSISADEASARAVPSLQGWRYFNIWVKRCLRSDNRVCLQFDLSDAMLTNRMLMLAMCFLVVSIGYVTLLMSNVVDGKRVSKNNSNTDKKVVETVIRDANGKKTIQTRVVIRSSTVSVVRKGGAKVLSASSSPYGNTVDKPEDWKTFRPVLVLCGLSTVVALAFTIKIFRLAPSAFQTPPSLPHLEIGEGLGKYSNINATFQPDLQQRWLYERSVQSKRDNKQLNISRDDVILAAPLQFNSLQGAGRVIPEKLSDVQMKKLQYHPGNMRLGYVVDQYLNDELKDPKKKQKLVSDASARQALAEWVLSSFVKNKNTTKPVQFWKISGDRRKWTLMDEQAIHVFVEGMVVEALENEVGFQVCDGDFCTA